MTFSKEKKLIEKTPLTKQLHQEKSSLLKTYQQKVFGEGSLLALIKYEITTLLLGNISGALGYLLRKKLYPNLFKSMGEGVANSVEEGSMLSSMTFFTINNQNSRLQ